MDVVEIQRLIEESQSIVDNRTCKELSVYLNYVNTVIIEEKKTELFQATLDYVCMSNRFRDLIERDYRCK